MALLIVGVLMMETGSGYAEPTVLPREQLKGLSFHEGLAAVRIGDHFGYVDESGNVVIPPRFDYAHVFSEGLARIVLQERSGYIDKSGNIVIPPLFIKAHTFSEGMARVCRPSAHSPLLTRVMGWFGWADIEGYPCGYINRQGHLVIDYQYVPAGGFKNGVAKVRNLDGRVLYIDKAGREVTRTPGILPLAPLDDD